MRRVVIAMLLWVVFAPPVSLQGQKQGQEQGQKQGLKAFGEVIDVRVLNLEVAVKDRDGYHLSGLQPGDFRLLVDGNVVPIEYFSEIRGGAALGAPAAPTIAEAAAAPSLVTVPSVTPGEVVGNSILVFVDNYFGHSRDRRIVLESLVDGLSGLGPKDRMAVVSFDGQNLDLVGNWETSQRAIERNLRKAIDMPAGGLRRRAEENLFGLQLRTANTGLIEESDENTKVQYIRRLSRQVDTVVKAVTATMRSMAQPPGRKVMLMTSGGWPSDPSIYAAGLDPDIRYRTQRFSPKRAFDDLAATANLLGYTIYPIDMAGRGNASRGNPDRNAAVGDTLRQEAPSTTPDGPLGKGAALAAPPPTGEQLSEESVDVQLAQFDATSGREHAVEAPLISLARETGGEAMLNSFRSSALPRALEDVNSYYWLGYTPTWARDDEEHKVEVEVLRKNVKARSRRGFQDFSRQAEVTMMVESNLLFATYLQGHSLEVELGEPTKKRGKLSLPLSLKIPMDQLVMLPVAGGFEANLELRVAVLDDKGARSEIPVIPVKLGGETRPLPGAHAVYDTRLTLRDIHQRLSLALYDVAGEKLLSTSIEVDPESI